MASRSVCVFDTNVLIDLDVGGLLDVVFDLPVRAVAPDVILAEAETLDEELLIQFGLERVTLSGEQVQEVAALLMRYRRPSANDVAALVVARSLYAILLTGDGSLRAVAEQEGVAVHGVLWLLDELHRQEVVSPATAKQALEAMLAAGSRLPEEECVQRLNQWESLIESGRST